MLEERLKQSFDKYYDAPIKAWHQFANYCEPIFFEKDDIIKARDTKEEYSYFILSGSAGIFLWKENNFVCLDFAFVNNFCCDYMSLLLRKPTPLQIVALEKSETSGFYTGLPAFFFATGFEIFRKNKFTLDIQYRFFFGQSHINNGIKRKGISNMIMVGFNRF